MLDHWDDILHRNRPAAFDLFGTSCTKLRIMRSVRVFFHYVFVCTALPVCSVEISENFVDGLSRNLERQLAFVYGSKGKCMGVIRSL